ncbi:MAG: hypothetical protein DCC65_18010 [Planctomycetota bacterium]|nr:MAG: hypothetical protein DCC65_18010 [Planctomycetota bacterium]
MVFVFVALGCTSASRAGLILEQSPVRVGGPAADTLFRDQFGLIGWQLLADNVQFDDPQTIRRIGWWGFYGGSGTPTTPPTGTETMRIRAYAPRPGDMLPDSNNILYETEFTNHSRIATGEIIEVGGVPPEYYYQVDLPNPLRLEADTLYWLEIVQVGDISTRFRWETAGGQQVGLAYLNDHILDWQFTSDSLAFQLWRVPEPGTLPVALIIALLISRRNWGTRRCHQK